MKYIPLFLAAEEDSWGKILNDIFSLELGQYDNLGFGDFAFRGLRDMIIAIIIGIILASYLSIFNRRVHGAFVRSLIDENCSTPQTAKTLAELGYMKNSAVRAAIKSGNTYRGIIRCVEAEDYYATRELARGEYEARSAASGEKCAPFNAPEYHYDFNEAHFYIPEEKHFSATIRYEKKGAGIITAIIITVLSIVMLWVILQFLPDVLQLVDNFVGEIKK